MKLISKILAWVRSLFLPPHEDIRLGPDNWKPHLVLLAPHRSEALLDDEQGPFFTPEEEDAWNNRFFSDEDIFDQPLAAQQEPSPFASPGHPSNCECLDCTLVTLTPHGHDD